MSGFDTHGMPDRLARKVDTVLRDRCDAILPVLERCTDSHNMMAVIRTAEAFGLQDVWLVESPLTEKDHKSRSRHARKKGTEDDKKELIDAICKRATDWLDIQRFKTTHQCLQAMKEGGYTVWVTDLSQQATRLDAPDLVIPDKLAVVFGRESDGVSRELLDAADRRVYLPLSGFADSLNLSVSAACILQQLFFIRPDFRGKMSEERRAALRASWYSTIARTPEQRQHFLDDLLPEAPKPFVDPRRPEEHRESWTPKKIKDRALAALKELEIDDTAISSAGNKRM